jgi:hypothetical protein
MEFFLLVTSNRKICHCLLRRTLVRLKGFSAKSIQPSAFSKTAIITPLPCHSDEGAICDNYLRKRMQEKTNASSTSDYNSHSHVIHRSLVPRDDKAEALQ